MTEFKREIRYDNVGFAYEADRLVLDGVSFSVKPGSITAIIGPTGSGKTTLTALLLRLFDLDRGTITIDGRDLRDFQVQTLRDNVAIALQENVLFAMSVRDNIRYAAPNASEDQIREAVRVAAMDDYVRRPARRSRHRALRPRRQALQRPTPAAVHRSGGGSQHTRLGYSTNRRRR